MSGRLSSDHSRSVSRSSQTHRSSQGQAVDGMPRHSSSRASRTSNPNVFSDEYSLEPIDLDQIIRPPSPASISSSTTLRSSNHPQKTVSTATTENENPFGDEARVSFDEPHRSSLPQKGMGSFSTNRNSVNSITNTQRNQSVSSRFSIPRAMSPYTGATGPSHPYAMYPQVGVSRTPSVGSTLTIRQHDRPLGESNGPEHPYAMYPQNVVEQGMDDDVIPVGFPGHNPGYQSPTGHRDDVVGDIIGPDGHTEPLPPYSRYPTGVVPKPPGAETMTDSHPPPEDQGVHSAPREHPPVPETPSGALVTDYIGNTNSTERNGEPQAPVTGVMAFEEKLKRKGKQVACCGLPVWTLILIATVILIGGSIGGVIGGVLSTKKAAERQQQPQPARSSGPYVVTVTAAPALDYALMTSTPANLKPVPTGNWLVPSMLRNYSRMCVEETDLNKAWSCMDKPSDFEVYLGDTQGNHSIVFPTGIPSTTFTYGAQAPFLPQPTQSLHLAIDTSDASLGPALFFYTLFNKLVILPDSAFSSSTVSARSYYPGNFSILDAFTNSNDVAQPGDKPWFCWWNSTMMEFFLYVNQTSTEYYSSGGTATTDNDLPASTATSSHSQSKRADGLADYPRRIKIEERRDYAGSQAPYCQQMQVMSGGQAVPLSNQVINIKEIEPKPTTTYINTDGGAHQTYTAKAQYATPCYCLSLTD